MARCRRRRAERALERALRNRDAELMAETLAEVERVQSAAEAPPPCECVVPGCPGCECGARAKAVREDVERRQAQWEAFFRVAFGLMERGGR